MVEGAVGKETESAVTQGSTDSEAAWVKGGGTGHGFPYIRVAPTKG